jgi:hypothetical protein
MISVSISVPVTMFNMCGVSMCLLVPIHDFCGCQSNCDYDQYVLCVYVTTRT